MHPGKTAQGKTHTRNDLNKTDCNSQRHGALAYLVLCAGIQWDRTLAVSDSWSSGERRGDFWPGRERHPFFFYRSKDSATSRSFGARKPFAGCKEDDECQEQKASNNHERELHVLAPHGPA